MQQISISEAAQAHFRRLLEQQEEGTNIRIFVVNPGTPSAECGVSYCPPNSVEASDTEIKFTGFSAFVDEISLPFLEEAKIDYVTEELGAQLTLKAPNAKMRKVADDAPLIERVEYVIQTQINPQLASHGGKITLLEITDDGYAILQFGGGCNGCSMVDVTLKDGVEKQLISLFPDELKVIAQCDDAARDGGILRPASFFARLHQPLPGGFNLGGQPGRLLEQRRSLGGRDDLPQGAGALRKHLLRQTKGGQQPAGRGIANARGERQAQPGGEFVKRHGGAKDGAAE